MTRKTGVVKWFNESKGFGFITPDDQSQSCFVHHSEILDEPRGRLNEGERVEFSTIPGAKGPACVQVKRITPQN